MAMSDSALLTATRLLVMLSRAKPGSMIATEHGTLTVVGRDGDVIMLRCELSASEDR